MSLENEFLMIIELESPVQSMRIHALEQAVQQGSSSELLQALISRKESETDPECQALLEQAIPIVEARNRGESDTPPPVLENDFLTCFVESDVSGKMSLLSQMHPKIIRALAPKAQWLLDNETNGMLRANIIRVFGPFWPEESRKDLTRLLLSKHLSTRMAVLEVLVKTAPDKLQRHLPKLLSSPDPRLKALAVRGLSKIDFEEAVLYLQPLFESDEPGSRLAVLQNSFYFPFERVKPMLLKMVALENDVQVVERAALLLAMNPDTEIPYRLWEIGESAVPEKAKVLREVVQQACKYLEKAGILEGGYSGYLEKLKEWIQERTLKRFVQDVIFRIDDPESTIAEIEASVIPRIKRPEVRKVFEAILKEPISEKAARQVGFWLNPEVKSVAPVTPAPEPARAPQSEAGSVIPGSGKSESPVESKKPAIPETASIQLPKSGKALLDKPFQEQVRIIAGLEKDDLAYVYKVFNELMTDSGTHPEVLATGLKTAMRLQMDSFGDTARQGLKSKDLKFELASIEYLGMYDSESIAPFIGRFFQDPNPRIQATALRVLQKMNPTKAVTTLKSLLFQGNQERQKIALGAMIHFDFTLVRDMLSQFVFSTENAALFDAGLSIFRNNPESQNLFLLYKLEKHFETGKKTEFAARVKAVRSENFKVLSDLGQLAGKDTEILEKEFRLKMDFEKTRSSKPAAPYSIKAISQGKDEGASSWFAKLKELGSNLY